MGRLLGRDSLVVVFPLLDLRRFPAFRGACSGQEAPLLGICSFTRFLSLPSSRRSGAAARDLFLRLVSCRREVSMSNAQ